MIVTAVPEFPIHTQLPPAATCTMSDDEEDDYMNDKFLANTEAPGVMPCHVKKKIIRQEISSKKGKSKKTVPLKLKESEQRETKLNEALPESNKGFAMLAKMGFKKGMGLGKDESGRKEPVPIQFRGVSRNGLGKEEQDKERKRKRVEKLMEIGKRRREQEEQLRGDFKSRMREKSNLRVVMSDLVKSRKACEQLDSAKGYEQVDHWYWPIIPQKEEEDEGEEIEEEEEEDEDEELDEPEPTDQLHILTHYLRVKHLYCIWCGTTYNDEDDLNTNCPGDTNEAHEDM